jgi:hypothetical protein
MLRLVTVINAFGGKLLGNFVHFEPGYKLGHSFQEEDQEEVERKVQESPELLPDRAKVVVRKCVKVKHIKNVLVFMSSRSVITA